MWITWDRACRWTQARLPLLAGGELVGADRRLVERHLIGCPSCRHHLHAHQTAQDVLHTAATISPTRSEAPSLWPALARQLREQRRPAAAHGTSWAGGWSWPALTLGLAATLLVTIGLGGVVYHAGSFAVPGPQGLLVRRAVPQRVGKVATPPVETREPAAEPEAVVASTDEVDRERVDPPTVDTGGTR